MFVLLLILKFQLIKTKNLQHFDYGSKKLNIIWQSTQFQHIESLCWITMGKSSRYYHSNTCIPCNLEWYDPCWLASAFVLFWPYWFIILWQHNASVSIDQKQMECLLKGCCQIHQHMETPLGSWRKWVVGVRLMAHRGLFIYTYIIHHSQNYPKLYKNRSKVVCQLTSHFILSKL